MNARARRGILQVVEQLAIGRNPWRQADGEAGASREVRIHVRADIHAGAAGIVDLGDRLRHLWPVGLARGFQVINFDRHIPLAADLDGLVDRFEQAVGFGPHVGDVDAAVRGHSFGELDQLARGGVFAGRIDEGRGEAERAVFHGSFHRGGHLREFAVDGSPCAMPFPYMRIVVAPTNDPKFGDAPCCCMASSQSRNPWGLAKRALVLRALSSVSAARVRPLAGALVEPSPMISVVTPWVSFADQAAVAGEQRAARLALNIDEAGSDHHSARIDSQLGERGRKRAGWGDALDAVATNSDVAMEPRVAGAVDDSAAGDDDVVRGWGLRKEGSAEQEGRESHTREFTIRA